MMPGCKILIVEDENIVALDLCRRLTKLGYQILGTASSAHNAIKLIEKNTPDIILMDIRIKGNVDGIEAAETIRRNFGIPIIFLTAYSEEATLLRASVTKPYGYLLKPFSEQELHVTIQVALERHRADHQLQKQEAHLKMALNAANLGTWELQTRDGPLTIEHPPVYNTRRLSNWQRLQTAIADTDRQAVQTGIDKLRELDNAEIQFEFPISGPQGERQWLALHGKSSPGGHATPRAVGVLQNITQRRRDEEQLRQAAMVFQCSVDGIVILDASKQIINANQSFTRITGYTIDDLKGRELPLLSPETLGGKRYRDIWREIEKSGAWQGEASWCCKNNEIVDTWVNIGSVPNNTGPPGQYVVIISDITAIRNIQEELSQIAYYDSLTKLPNRNLFLDRLAQAMAKAKRNGEKLALLFIDLDHFKRVNDTLGHQMGDSMLRAVALRLYAELRATDTLCRIGGDEFIVIMENPRTRNDMETLADKLLNALNQPLTLGKTETTPGGSIGISLYPDDAEDSEELIKMADTAMYSAKNRGRSCFAFYHPDMTAQTLHYFIRENELRLALKERHFRIHYQSQFDTQSGALIGLEALLRWQHPERGLLSAGEVIPIAEGSPLIIDIGGWVIEECCRQIREWLDAGLEPPRVALNVSVRQLQDNAIINAIESALSHYALPPDYLELEITESCLQDNENSLVCLQYLEKRGILISIDDFGTGYSCMSSLKALPIHRLKIDQAFVRDLPENESDCAIARAIIALGKELNLKVIAEGIETPEQAEFMRRAGCDALQGFKLGRPVEAAVIASLLSPRPDTRDTL